MKTMVYNFYSVYLKKNCDGKVKYGQQYYDFDEGIIRVPKTGFCMP